MWDTDRACRRNEGKRGTVNEGRDGVRLQSKRNIGKKKVGLMEKDHGRNDKTGR